MMAARKGAAMVEPKASEALVREVVFVGSWVDVALVDNLLDNEGIATLVAADKRAPRYRRAIYVLDASDLERARAIVLRFVRHEPLVDPKSYRSWRCRDCNELIEGQVAACWKCGAAKPPSTSA